MANTPLTISLPVEAELIIRIKGSDELHVLGTVTYKTDVDVELVNAFQYRRND